MSNIHISTTILAGNLGDGWADNNAAAHALGEMTKATWRRDLREFTAAGHAVTIRVDVRENAEGSGPETVVDCDDYDIEIAVRRALTDAGVIWERFCDAAPAELLGE